MTTVFFVRHAEPNYENHDDVSRELSYKGLEDRRLVTDFLLDKQIDIVLSSHIKEQLIRYEILQRKKVWILPL